MGTSKVMSLREAIGAFVANGSTIAIEGFTHLIPFAAAHEIIRQEKRDLTLCRLTPDLVGDQLAAAGSISSLVFSWLGNPGVGSLHAIRRRIEEPHQERLSVEEYSHYGMVCRYVAGASGLPFYPLHSYAGSDLPAVNPLIRQVEDPYGGEPVHVVPPLAPDVAIVHVQRASESGDCQVWGIPGCQKEAAFASAAVIVTCEEIVTEDVIRADPNRTLIPGAIVDAVVEVPGGCHPSYAQGYYDRDNSFYVEWDGISRDPARLEIWIEEWIMGVEGHDGYLARLGERWKALQTVGEPSGAVVYGSYR